MQTWAKFMEAITVDGNVAQAARLRTNHLDDSGFQVFKQGASMSDFNNISFATERMLQLMDRLVPKPRETWNHDDEYILYFASALRARNRCDQTTKDTLSTFDQRLTRELSPTVTIEDWDWVAKATVQDYAWATTRF